MPFTQTYIPLYVRIKKFNNKVDNKPNTDTQVDISISHTHTAALSPSRVHIRFSSNHLSTVSLASSFWGENDGT